MDKSRIYILQILGIIMLLLGYFMSDPPDSASVMHFDISNTHTISGTKQGGNNRAEIVTVSTDNKGHHKQRSSKIFSFQVILPNPIAVFCYTYGLHTVYNPQCAEHYLCLYAKEINPPPPKVA